MLLHLKTLEPNLLNKYLSWTGNLSFRLWQCFHCSFFSSVYREGLIILFIYGSMSVQAKTRYMAAQIVSFWPSFVMFWSTATGTFSPCQPLLPRLKNAKPGRSFEFSSQWLQCTGSLCIVVDCRQLYLWHQANWYFAFFDVSVILLAHNHLKFPDPLIHVPYSTVFFLISGSFASIKWWWLTSQQSILDFGNLTAAGGCFLF